MEILVEELMHLHTCSISFRDVFKSQQATQIFISGYNNFVQKASALSTPLDAWTMRIADKLSHLGLALALDTNVAGSQKREVRCSLVSIFDMVP